MKDTFKRKPVSHITHTRTLTNIDFVKGKMSQRTTYKLELTLECGHVQMSNGGRLPKQVTCKACKAAGADRYQYDPSVQDGEVLES